MTSRVSRLLFAICLFLTALHIGLQDIVDSHSLAAFQEYKEAGVSLLAHWQP